MDPITGSASITLQPTTIVPAAPPHTYFGVAQSLLPGVKILAVASPCPALALALVSAHILECLLKAYLSRDGSDAALKNPAVRHDLKGGPGRFCRLSWWGTRLLLSGGKATAAGRREALKARTLGGVKVDWSTGGEELENDPRLSGAPLPVC